MNAQKKQLIIVAVLAVALCAVLVYQFKKKPPLPENLAAPAVKTAQAPGTPAAPKPAATPAAKSGPIQINKADVDIDDLLTGIKEVDFDYEKDHLPRDPMLPLVGTANKITGKEKEGEPPVAPATATKVMNKVVSGILWDPRRPMAVVDNLVVFPGYKYDDGTTVESIERDRVTFKVGDSLIQVELKEL